MCVCVCVRALTVHVLPPASSEATLSPLDSVVTRVSGTFSKDWRQEVNSEGGRGGEGRERRRREGGKE